MAATKYEYSVMDTLNDKVESSKLLTEIRNSNITIAVDYINSNGDDIDIWMKDEISVGEKTILDGVVAGHDGVADTNITPKTFDKKLLVHESSRPLDTFPTFVGEGDDQTHHHLVGGGERMIFTHNEGDPLEYSLYVDFNVIENRTFIHEGYVMWKNAIHDIVMFDVVPKVTAYSEGSNTFFNVDPTTGLVVPAAGDGVADIQPEDMKLIKIPINLDHPEQKQMPAFWCADWDEDTQSLINLTAKPNGDGYYNMFTQEILLERVANFSLLNDGFMKMQSADVAELMHNMRIKLTFKTEAPDHAWKMSCLLTMHRKYSKSFTH